MIFYWQVSEGLSFLHSSVKMVHGNITPENIILNKSGAWKIMGFDFCIQSTNPSEQEVITFMFIIIQFQIQVFVGNQFHDLAFQCRITYLIFTSVFCWRKVRTYGTGLDWSAAFDCLRKRAWLDSVGSQWISDGSYRGWSLCHFCSLLWWMTHDPASLSVLCLLSACLILPKINSPLQQCFDFTLHFPTLNIQT